MLADERTRSVKAELSRDHELISRPCRQPGTAETDGTTRATGPTVTTRCRQHRVFASPDSQTGGPAAGASPCAGLAPQPARRRGPVQPGQDIDPQVQGWINYYGAFYRSELCFLAWRINEHLVRWAMHKFKRFPASTPKRRPGCRRSTSTGPACSPTGSSSRSPQAGLRGPDDGRPSRHAPGGDIQVSQAGQYAPQEGGPGQRHLVGLRSHNRSGVTDRPPSSSCAGRAPRAPRMKPADEIGKTPPAHPHQPARPSRRRSNPRQPATRTRRRFHANATTTDANGCNTCRVLKRDTMS